MPDSSGPPYKVCCAFKDLEQLKAWAEKATALGFREQYLAALKVINQ